MFTTNSVWHLSCDLFIRECTINAGLWTQRLLLLDIVCGACARPLNYNNCPRCVSLYRDSWNWLHELGIVLVTRQERVEDRVYAGENYSEMCVWNITQHGLLACWRSSNALRVARRAGRLPLARYLAATVTLLSWAFVLPCSLYRLLFYTRM
jgi:hypothetical protein